MQYGKVKLYLIAPVWRLKSSNLDLAQNRASRPALSVGLAAWLMKWCAIY